MPAPYQIVGMLATDEVDPETGLQIISRTGSGHQWARKLADSACKNVAPEPRPLFRMASPVRIEECRALGGRIVEGRRQAPRNQRPAPAHDGAL